MSILAFLGKATETGNPYWGTKPHVVRSVTTGALRDRVLARVGRKRGKVEIVEETYWGGYSEYTQENSVEFSVLVGGKTVVSFAPDEEHTSMRDERSGDSVFARFDDWLRAAESPLGVMRRKTRLDRDASSAWEKSWRLVEESDIKVLRRYRGREVTLRRRASDWVHLSRGPSAKLADAPMHRFDLIETEELPGGFVAVRSTVSSEPFPAESDGYAEAMAFYTDRVLAMTRFRWM